MDKYEILANSILELLEKNFYKEIVESSVILIKTPGIHTKYSNFATNMRELFREIFRDLAPDEEVKSCEWYEKETESNENDITRKQRMEYAIKGGLSDSFLQEELEIDLTEITTVLNKIIRDLNKYTHINEKVYYREIEKNHVMVEETLTFLKEFLSKINDLRSMVEERLAEKLYEKISVALTEDVIQDIDALATHYSVEGSTIDTIKIIEMDSVQINVDIKGSVDVKHQYGSNRDFKKGDGERFESSYPYSISLSLNINSPLDVSIKPNDIVVDSSSFYE